ncbi:MAG: hypothetical protein EOL87_12290 [Spartobacteria bacterium]|nr:hypothetical protein [Spartobacteria bacterium]
MRTTLDLDDELAIQAKKAAVDRRCSLKALVEEGLRRVLADKMESNAAVPAERFAALANTVWNNIGADRYVKDIRKGWK